MTAYDVETLANNHVVAVVNICRESAGPLQFYERKGISQLRIPTPDFAEPKYDDVIRAVKFIHNSLRKSVDAKEVDEKEPVRLDRVFIHCKGGRGRAITVALCYLLYKHRSKRLSPTEAMDIIIAKRSVAVYSVVKYKVVQKFHQALLENAPVLRFVP